MTLTVTPPMRFLIGRLRRGIADPIKFTDDDLLGFLNDGYQAACERSRCLRTYTVVTIISGQQEYDLPGDWVSTIGAYQAGSRLVPVGVKIAPRSDIGPYYYSFDGVFGLATTPTAAGSVVLYYARAPSPLLIADTPDPDFGPEWYHLLRHYAAQQVYLYGYGAEYLKRAEYQRALFDQGVEKLKRLVTTQDRSQNQKVTHALNLVGPPVGVGF